MCGQNITGTIGSVALGDSFPVRTMGVINLTKNSFYSGSIRKSPQEIVQTALAIQSQGADAIDLGARSTAPYRGYEISEEQEGRLLSAAVDLICTRVELPISADTTRLSVARRAIRKGATIINDVYGLTQRDGKAIARLTASNECSLILTAHERRPRKLPDPIRRVLGALAGSIELARIEGVENKRITIDPGIGFFLDKKLSNVDWNCIILSRLNEFRILGRPMCLGVSRKRFIGTLLGNKLPDERLFGSLSATSIAVYNGCHLIRTHDAGATIEAIRIAEGIRKKATISETRNLAWVKES